MSGEEVPDDPFAGDVAAGEPGDPSITGGGVLDRLMDGSIPGPSVGQLQGDYGINHHWAIALRGAVRAAAGDGVPPIFEIVFGSSLGTIRAIRSGDGVEGDADNAWWEGSDPV